MINRDGRKKARQQLVPLIMKHRQKSNRNPLDYVVIFGYGNNYIGDYTYKYSGNIRKNFQTMHQMNFKSFFDDVHKKRHNLNYDKSFVNVTLPLIPPNDQPYSFPWGATEPDLSYENPRHIDIEIYNLKT